MRQIIGILLSFCLIQAAFAEHLDLTQLLRELQKTQGIEGKLNKEREQKFAENKQQQQEFVEAAKQEFEPINQKYLELKAQVEKNEAELAQLETLLKENTGDLEQLFTTTKQTAGDLKILFDNSIISAQFPKRSKNLEAIANSKTLATIEEIEALWIMLQEEMTESGRVVKFSAKVTDSAGDNATQRQVTRIGSFNAFSEGQYLMLENDAFVPFPKQPDAPYPEMLKNMEKATSGLVDVGIDPTAGVVLNLLIQTPNVKERIQQGGIVGYLILVLGAFGFVFAIFKLVQLSQTGQKMNAQIQDSEAREDNPLGRIFLAAQQSGETDSENLELLLDEAITREVPVLERGLSMIKLLAAVAPLLGLLGTVTGMIATFQSISLFGTGDPKLMANGISQALVTTMLGLCVAIPLLFLHSIVASRSHLLIQILDEQSAGLLNKRLKK